MKKSLIFVFGFVFFAVVALAEKIDGYTQLEYVDTTGKEWFDTGLKVKGSYNINAKLQSFAIGYSPADKRLTGWDAPRYALYGGADAFRKQQSDGTYTTQKAFMASSFVYDKYLPAVMSTYNGGTYTYFYPLTPAPCVPAEYSYLRDKTKVAFQYGGSTYASKHTIDNFESTNNFFIAAANTPEKNTHPSVMRIWYFKILDALNGNALLRDYVPVRRNSDGEIGLYDKVEGVFYGNASGQGAVKAGPYLYDEWVVTERELFNYGSEWTVSGYEGTETLSCVPVLLRLSPETVTRFSYKQCLDHGKDIAFSSKEDFSDRLPYEIEKWDTSGESLIWVKIPKLSGKDTKIYMRWGRTSPAANLPSTEVWSDYLGVWHFSDYDEKIGVVDSTQYARHAKVVANKETAPVSLPTRVESKVGYGLQTAANNHFEVESFQHFHDKYDDMPLYFTVSIWAKKLGTYTGYQDILGCYENLNDFATPHRYGWVVEYNTSSAYAFHYGKTAKAYVSGSGGALITDWQYHTFSSDTMTIRLYLNGVQKSYLTSSSYDSNKTANNGGKALGGVDKPFSILGPNCEMPAVADEVRISKTVLSATRIKADYQMMTNPDFAVSSPVNIIRIPHFKLIVR